jgi:hypothetical protein
METMTQFSSLREKIAFETQQRQARDEGFAALVSVAHAQGIQAGRDCKPIPMIVCTSTGKPIEQLDEGACGFAWIAFPGNTAFGRWAKKQGIARPQYPKGLCIWVREFGQSVDRKAAYAGAYAQTLRNAGIDCYAGDRLD